MFIKTICRLSILLLTLGLTACVEEDTYAKQREKEVAQINNFLKKGTTIRDLRDNYDLITIAPNIKVIDEATFKAQGETTKVEENEYVLFAATGVYMQIVRKGTGTPIAQGERTTLLARYTEFNISTHKILSTNLGWNNEQNLDRIAIANNSGTYVASFLSGMMKSTYGTSFVPKAWLTPLPYLRLGRQTSLDEEIAKVRLIVPSTEGQSKASQAVYPTFYEITYQRSR